MVIFSGLDSLSRSPSAEASAIRAARRAKPTQIYGDLVYLASLGDDHLESHIGLRESAQLVLQIFKTAQSAKTHQAQCIDIAAQSYYLLNAVDGGINGRAIDIDNVLHSHVVQLNESLAEIHKTLKRFSSWWVYARLKTAPLELKACHDLIAHCMDMYFMLLRCSLAAPPRMPVTKPRRGRRAMYGVSPPVPPEKDRVAKPHIRAKITIPPPAAAELRIRVSRSQAA